MSRTLATLVSLGLAITLGGCATSPNEGSPNGSASATPTPDQILVPTAIPVDAIAADPVIYDTGFDWFSFKVGNGPTWCTIDVVADSVLCEQNEAAAQYQPIPAPEDCVGSYGYQVQLWGQKPEQGEIAGFACASGQYQDPDLAQVLPSGQSLTVASITCYVQDVTARCENTGGQWIALGPATWSINK